MPLGRASVQAYACITLIHMDLDFAQPYKGGVQLVLFSIRLSVVALLINRTQPLVPVGIQSSTQLKHQSDTEAVFTEVKKIYCRSGN